MLFWVGYTFYILLMAAIGMLIPADFHYPFGFFAGTVGTLIIILKRQ